MLALQPYSAPFLAALPLALGMTGPPPRAHDPLLDEIAKVQQEMLSVPKVGPEVGQMHLRLAALHLRGGSADRARSELKLAERAGAGLASIQKQLSACAESEGDFAEAEFLLNELLLGARGDLALLRKRARVRSRLGKHLASACDLAAVRSLAGGEFSIEDELRLANTLVNGGHTRAGIASLERALQSHGPNAVLVQRAIELEMVVGAFAEALARTETLLRGGVALHVVAGIRGDIYSALGDTAKAEDQWRRAASGLRRGRGRRARAKSWSRPRGAQVEATASWLPPRRTGTRRGEDQ